MTDPRALYPEAILDHSRNPRNQGRLGDATHSHRMSNPLCGDRVTIALRLDDERIADVNFEARGCALCVAAASMLTEWVRDRTLDELPDLERAIENAVDPEAESVSGEVAVWEALRGFPARKRCATLPWETLRAALNADPQ
ncbi:MAG: Fe-S cluster assembly sulfur transfer protein SufU [Myxococcota bacterium]